MDWGCQLVSHGNRGAIGPGPRGAFLHVDVALHDTEEVGPVVANRRFALDLNSIVVFLESVVDEGNRSEAPKLVQHLSTGMSQDVVFDRRRDAGSLGESELGGPGFFAGRRG